MKKTAGKRRAAGALAMWLGCAVAGSVLAQSTTAPTPPQDQQNTRQDPQTAGQNPQNAGQPAPPSTQPLTPAPTPQGEVLFQSHGEPPAPGTVPEPNRTPLPPAAQTDAKPGTAPPDITDAERAGLAIARYDLDLRLVPAAGTLTARARVTVRNDTDHPLRRIGLQVSGSLTWDRVSLSETANNGGSQPLAFTQHPLDTDADHTGRATEALIELPTSLAPGKSLALDTFYSGPAVASSGRLERLGATPAQSAAADWDGIGSAASGLRGFGNVLWYPVSAPQMFLGEGARLFDAVGAARLRNRETRFRLRLAVEYSGEPPAAAYFCARREPLRALNDNAEAPAAYGQGVATADFAEEPVGFRIPSLFLLAQPEQVLGEAGDGGSSSSSQSSAGEGSLPAAPALKARPGAVAPPPPELAGALVAVETTDSRALPALQAAVDRVAPLLQDWFGPRPLSALTVLDHPGQPFEDGPLLVAPLGTLGTSDGLPALAHGLTHAFVQTGQPWMDEGLAQFFTLLWTEREQGRASAASQWADMVQPLGLGEPAIENGRFSGPGQPLISASSDVFYRRKAAAVWFMLRDIAGEAPLRSALSAWRVRQPDPAATPASEALAFEALLEKLSGKDLGPIFADWVLGDRGLPELAITEVAPRELPAGPGHPHGGWLVAVSVHNSGGAVADVPVIIRSGTYSTTERLRIPGQGSATARVLVEAPPTEVVVNDGIVPELGATRHTWQAPAH